MLIGDLQDEKWESNSGQNISAYFCHPGQQDVKWGRFFPCVNRSTNSVASSHMVTSCCEFRIPAMGESELFERSEHLAGRDGASGKPKSFSERIPH